MIREIRVVMRKELKEMGTEGGGGRRGRLTPLIGVAVAGVLIPVNLGVRYVQPDTMLVMGMVLPVLFILPVVADAFAGERERHTLETLLATRLPDQAILFGKLAAVVAYAFVLSVLALVVGVATVNVAHPEARPLVFPLATLGATLVEVVLVGTLMGGVGLLISLGATTVRQAQQRLSMVLFVPILLPVLAKALPTGVKRSIQGMLVSGRLTAAQILFGTLIVLTAGVLFASNRRFRRSRLITA